MSKRINYKSYLKSDDWKEKRNIKLKFKKCCGVCGSKDNIHIHHLVYKNLFDIYPTDLRRLCKNCHFTLHYLIKSNKIKYKKKSISLYKLRLRSHHSQWAIIKLAIQKERKFGYWNQSNHFIPISQWNLNF